MEKPPVLSEEEIEKWCSEHKAGKGGLCYVANSCEICKRRIQRDKDAEWYEKKYLIPDYEYNLQQARQDTAREIIGKLLREGANKTFAGEEWWCKLKSRFPIPPNPVGSADV